MPFAPKAALAAALLWLGGAGFAQAQAVPVVQAGAGGRFETRLDPKTAIPGFTAPQVQAFRAQVTALASQLRAMPTVAEPPSPVCHRLGSWLSIVNRSQVLSAEVTVLTPIWFRDGRCHNMTGTGLTFAVNQLAALSDYDNPSLHEGGAATWQVLPITRLEPGMIRLGETRVAFTRADVPLLLKAPTGRYVAEKVRAGEAAARSSIERAEVFTEADLQAWLKTEKPRLAAESEERLRGLAPYAKPEDMARYRAAAAKTLMELEEAQRRKVAASRQFAQAAGTSIDALEARRWKAVQAALTPSQRDLPACMPTAAMGRAALDLSGNCPLDRTVFEINPGYFDLKRPSDIQLLVVGTDPLTPHGEDDAKLASRIAMWRALDLRALAALVRG